MRFLLALLALHSATLAATADKLEELKKQFPAHVSGPVTEKSDPAVQDCFNRYKNRVEKLTMPTLSKDLFKLQNEADGEAYRIAARMRSETLTASGRHAAQQNETWLRQKLIPYLKRLAQFQRGH